MSEDSTRHLANADMRFIREQLESIDSRLAAVDDRLTTLEDRVDRRLQETRPIWERVLNEIIETRAEVVKVEDRLGRIENEVKDMRRMFRHAFTDVARVQEDLEERLDKLEGHNLPQ